MRKRASLKKANWSLEREVWYQTECNKMLFDRDIEIAINDKIVILKPTDNQEVLFQITKIKTMWFEIWLRLKELY